MMRRSLFVLLFRIYIELHTEQVAFLFIQKGEINSDNIIQARESTLGKNQPLQSFTIIPLWVYSGNQTTWQVIWTHLKLGSEPSVG